MKISRKKLNNKWFTFKGKVRFEIRAFPFSLYESAVNVETKKLENTSLKDQYLFCLQGWEGLEDEDTKKSFVYDDDNKLFLFDHYEDIRNFVFEKANLISKNEDKEAKN